MEDKNFLRRIAAFVCVLLFTGLLLGAGYVMNTLLDPNQGNTDPTQLPTEAPTEEPTEAPTEAPTETPTEEPTEEPTVPVLSMPAITLTARHSFLYILETGQFLMLKGDEDDRIYPASLTKLFSAYVALMYMDAETRVTVGSEVYSVSKDSSKAGLTPGDVLTVRQLVQAMLLPSGNDAAMTLAAATGRKLAGNQKLSYQNAIARFVEEMNTAAQSLGFTGSHFENPDGYHNTNHFTTCWDMQKIGTLALSQPVIRQVMGTQKVVLDLQYDYPGGWKNTNELIQPKSKYYNPAAIGMKTGYTRAAGYCLMSAFTYEGKTILIGIFGCPEMTDRFTDAQNVYNTYIRQE